MVLPGDRFVLRSMGAQVTIGGGVVLDPNPVSRSPEPGWLEALESGDPTQHHAARADSQAGRRDARRGAFAGRLGLAGGGAHRGGRCLRSRRWSVERYALSGGSWMPARKRLDGYAGSGALRERPESPELTGVRGPHRNRPRPTSSPTRCSGSSPGGRSCGSDATGVSLPGRGRGAGGARTKRRRELLEEISRAGIGAPGIGGDDSGAPAARPARGGRSRSPGRSLFASREAAAKRCWNRSKAVCRAEGEVSLAAFRDRLATSRKLRPGVAGARRCRGRDRAARETCAC